LVEFIFFDGGSFSYCIPILRPNSVQNVVRMLFFRKVVCIKKNVTFALWNYKHWISMLKTTITPNENTYSLPISANYVGEMLDTFENKKIQNHLTNFGLG